MNGHGCTRMDTDFIANKKSGWKGWVRRVCVMMLNPCKVQRDPQGISAIDLRRRCGEMNS